MSIVEKAVSRGGRNRRVESKPDALRSDDAKVQNPPAADVQDEVIQISGLAERGLATVLENPDLSQAMRFLKRSLLSKIFDPNMPESHTGKKIMLTSAMPGAGKSFVALNLAISIAQEQLIDVVLIDADTVRHNLSSTLGSNDCRGLLDILSTRDMKAAGMPTELPGLRFIPSGRSRGDAPELLASEYMSDLLDSLADPNTVVVMDTTPLLVSSEADAMSSQTDHTIIVVEAGNTSADEIETMLQMLEKSGSSVSFVMNKLRSMGDSGSADNYYYYRY